MKWGDVLAASGLSDQTLLTARTKNASMLGLTKARIEKALQWEPGSVDAILKGGEPVNRGPDDGQVAASEAEMPADPWQRQLYFALAPLPHEMRISLIQAASALRRANEKAHENDVPSTTGERWHQAQ